MESVQVKVDGMTCMGCVASVTRVLQGVKGVGNIEVSLEKGLARVEYDPAIASVDQLRSAVESAGYDATL